MRRLVLLACLALLVAGCGGSGAPLANEGGGPARNVPIWIHDERLPPGAVPGAHLFAVGGCTACHTYAGSGGQNLGAPDLTDIGSRNLGIAFQIAHLRCPSCVHSGSPMPPFGAFGPKRLKQLAIFLEASKGTH
jgi:mono/diheme cytochrome c family protein